jgi:hypothetical protein
MRYRPRDSFAHRMVQRVEESLGDNPEVRSFQGMGSAVLEECLQIPPPPIGLLRGQAHALIFEEPQDPRGGLSLLQWFDTHGAATHRRPPCRPKEKAHLSSACPIAFTKLWPNNVRHKKEEDMKGMLAAVVTVVLVVSCFAETNRPKAGATDTNVIAVVLGKKITTGEKDKLVRLIFGGTPGAVREGEQDRTDARGTRRFREQDRGEGESTTGQV